MLLLRPSHGSRVRETFSSSLNSLTVCIGGTSPGRSAPLPAQPERTRTVTMINLIALLYKPDLQPYLTTLTSRVDRSERPCYRDIRDCRGARRGDRTPGAGSRGPPEPG